MEQIIEQTVSQYPSIELPTQQMEKHFITANTIAGNLTKMKNSHLIMNALLLL